MERAIQYVRHSFFAARPFTTLTDFNRQALDWRNQVAHQRPWPDDDSCTVAQVFAEEKAHLLPLPAHPFSCDLVHTVRAESVGSVRPGLGGAPVVTYTLDRDDMLKLREALKAIARMHVAAGARALVPCVGGLPIVIRPDQIGLLDDASLDPRSYVAILSHLFGGCVMGADPARSVCDAAGRVRGYEALHVADASVIPTNLGVNPQHTIMGLATMFAETMLAA